MATIQFEKSEKRLIYPKYAERVPQWSPTNPIERFVFFFSEDSNLKKNPNKAYLSN